MVGDLVIFWRIGKDFPVPSIYQSNFYCIICYCSLTLSWRRLLSYRNQSIDLLCKSMDWFLYDNSLCHERVNSTLSKSLYFINKYWTNKSTKINSKSVQKVFIPKIQILLLKFLLCYESLKLSSSSANLSSTLVSGQHLLSPPLYKGEWSRKNLA